MYFSIHCISKNLARYNDKDPIKIEPISTSLLWFHTVSNENLVNCKFLWQKLIRWIQNEHVLLKHNDFEQNCSKFLLTFINIFFLSFFLLPVPRMLLRIWPFSTCPPVGNHIPSSGPCLVRICMFPVLTIIHILSEHWDLYSPCLMNVCATKTRTWFYVLSKGWALL